MNKEKQSGKTPWWQPGLMLFYRLSGWIIGPIIVAMIVGKWLDRKYNSEPWLFLLCIGVSFFISMFGIVHDAITEMKKIDKLSKDNKDKEKLKKD